MRHGSNGNRLRRIDAALTRHDAGAWRPGDPSTLSDAELALAVDDAKQRWLDGLSNAELVAVATESAAIVAKRLRGEPVERRPPTPAEARYDALSREQIRRMSAADVRAESADLARRITARAAVNPDLAAALAPAAGLLAEMAGPADDAPAEESQT